MEHTSSQRNRAEHKSTQGKLSLKYRGKENVHWYYMKCNNSFNTFNINISLLLWVFTGVYSRLKSGNLTLTSQQVSYCGLMY